MLLPLHAAEDVQKPRVGGAFTFLPNHCAASLRQSL